MNIKKIVIIGPESTGKSMLSEKLAKHFKTIWVKEYARLYLEKNGTDYNYDTLSLIANGQMQLENEAIEILTNKNNHSKTLILDTNLTVVKVWSEYVFNKCDNKTLTQIASKNYDAFILCNTDVAWVKDNLREYPNIETREKLFKYYKEELTEQTKPWIILSGNDYEFRLQKAISFIENI